MIKDIIILAKKYKIAGNINSISNAIQEEFLRKYHYNSYKDIPPDKIERLEEYISIRKDEIDNELKKQVKNPQYISWIYDIIKSGNQGIEDIQKLINEIERFEYIRNHVDAINDKFEKQDKKKINKNIFNIFNFKTYSDLHSFVSEYTSYLEDNIERDKLKSKPINFPLVYENSKYKVYSIGEMEADDFQELYGEKGWDTGWCIAQGTVDFNEYLGEYDSYYLILNKSNEPISLISLDDLQFKNVHDDTMIKLDKYIIDAVDHILSINGLEAEDIDEDEYNDFEGYMLTKAFESNAQQLELFEEYDNYVTEHMYHDVAFIKDKNDKYNYFVTKNGNLSLIISTNLQNILYINSMDQDIVEAFYNIFNSERYPLNYFVVRNYSLLTNFNLKEYFDFFIKNKFIDGLSKILSTNKKLSKEQKEKGIDFILENARYKSDLAILNTIYSETNDKFLKEYINSKVLSSKRIKNISEQIKKYHSKEDIEAIIDELLSKVMLDGTIIDVLSKYIYVVSKEYKEKFIDFIYDENKIEAVFSNNSDTVSFSHNLDKEFNNMLIEKCLNGDKEKYKLMLLTQFNKMSEEQKNKTLKEVSGIDYVSSYLTNLIMNYHIEDKLIPRIVDIMVTDSEINFSNILKLIKKNNIKNRLFISEFIKKALLNAYWAVVADLMVDREIVADNNLMNFIINDNYPYKNDLLRYLILKPTIHLKEEQVEKIIDFFIKNKNTMLLTELLFGDELHYYKDILRKVAIYLLKYSDNDDPHLLRRILSEFKNDNNISNDVLDKFRKFYNKNDKYFKEEIQRIIDKQLYNSDKQLEYYKKLL